MGKSKAPHIQIPASLSEEFTASEKDKFARDFAPATSREKSAKETAYRPLFANIVKYMRMNGMPLEEIAAAFKVDKLTIDRWKRAHKDFADAFHLGSGLADARVQRSLYRLAMGYARVDVKIFRYKRRIIYAPCTVHVPANVEAAMLWLANRRPNEWSLKPHVGRNVMADTHANSKPPRTTKDMEFEVLRPNEDQSEYLARGGNYS